MARGQLRHPYKRSRSQTRSVSWCSNPRPMDDAVAQTTAWGINKTKLKLPKCGSPARSVACAHNARPSCMRQRLWTLSAALREYFYRKEAGQLMVSRKLCKKWGVCALHLFMKTMLSPSCPISLDNIILRSGLRAADDTILAKASLATYPRVVGNTGVTAV